MHRPRIFVTDFLAGPLIHEMEILGDIADVTALAASHEQDLIGQVENTQTLLTIDGEPEEVGLSYRPDQLVAPDGALLSVQLGQQRVSIRARDIS